MIKDIFKKLFSTPKNSKSEIKVSTYVDNRKVKTFNRYIAMSLLEEGERLDEKTLHKFTKDGVEMKFCMHCGRWLTLDNFYVANANQRDGLFSKCKSCTNNAKYDNKDKQKKVLTYSKAKSMLKEGETLDEKTLHKFTKDGVEMKYCMHCGRWLTLDNFYVANTNQRDGLRCECKKCETERKKKLRSKKTSNTSAYSLLMKEKAKPLIDEGGVFDENTFHVLTKDLIEMKYCVKCEKWHPLNEFSKDKGNSRDGLQTYCKQCQWRYRYKNTIPEVVSPSVETKSTIGDKFNEIKVLINKENDDLKQRLAKQEEEIQCLKTENKSLTEEKNHYKSLFDNCLAVFDTIGVKYDNGKVTIPDRKISKEDIERYLETHNDITPRVLIGSLSRYDNRYRFYCKDTITGLTTPIVEEVYA